MTLNVGELRTAKRIKLAQTKMLLLFQLLNVSYTALSDEESNRLAALIEQDLQEQEEIHDDNVRLMVSIRQHHIL